MTLDELANELAQLRAAFNATLERHAVELAQERERREQAEAQRDALLKELDATKKELLFARTKIDALLKRVFGLKRETIDKAQLELAFQAEFGQEPEALLPAEVAQAAEAPDDEETAATQRRRRNHPGRRALPANLERVVEHLFPEETDCCDRAMKDAGVEVVELLDYVPSQYRILELHNTSAPARLTITGSCVQAISASAVREVRSERPDACEGCREKFDHHLPLNRQAEIAERFGVRLCKATMCGWLSEMAFAFQPIVREMTRQSFASGIINFDDTGVRVLDPELPNGSFKGHMWIYIGHSKNAVFEFTPTRSGAGPAEYLRHFRGYCQADAASQHDGLFLEGSGRVEVGCMAHTRRKFFEAMKTDHHLASVAVAFIRRLYIIEREIGGSPPDVKRQVRQERAVPILDKFGAWLEEKAPTVLPKSPFAGALGYARNQWDALKRYVEDGRLAIDNNASERGLRRVAVGRNNWTFAGSEDGARNAATFYSIMYTCRLNGIDPFPYMVDVLRRYSTTPQSEIFRLTPRGWIAERAAASSVVVTPLLMPA